MSFFRSGIPSQRCRLFPDLPLLVIVGQECRRDGGQTGCPEVANEVTAPGGRDRMEGGRLDEAIDGARRADEIGAVVHLAIPGVLMPDL